MDIIKSIVILSFISGILCDTNYRLKTAVIPSKYEITITPYFDTGDNRAFTFDGEVTITVSTSEAGIKRIKLHSADLEFESQNITIRHDKNTVELNREIPLEFDKTYEFESQNITIRHDKTTVELNRELPLEFNKTYEFEPQNITIRHDKNTVELNREHPLEFDKTYEFVYINLAVPLEVKTNYSVNILYKGQLRGDLNGLHRSKNVENGQTKWFAATHMWPVHARNVFPCFDEPEFKARFILHVDRPENYSPTLTNTKLQNTTVLGNGYVRERFFPTPVMSTYLLAILISEFQNGGRFQIGDRELGVWVRPEATNQSDYAFDFGKRVVAALGNFFGIDYYSVDANLNLKHVGIPDFGVTAMENWGLIKYRELLLMYDPQGSTPLYKYEVAKNLAHETTHMWFGNLVTCHWFSDAWLNEGFATYFQDYITAIVQPELGSADLLVTSSMYQAYAADEIKSQVAMTNNEVNSPAEIKGHFNAIIYEKGASVIRMIHNLIGDEAFRKGLNGYLNSGRLGVVTPVMLYASLDKAVNFTNSLAAYPNRTVAQVMSAWVSQAGHPVLKVEFNQTSGEVMLTQNRFYANISHKSNEIYPIPITYTTKSEANFKNTKPSFIMADKTYSFGNFSLDQWIIFNLQETGFYRVNYDEHLWSLIGEALRGPNRTTIHYLNRAKIVNDVFALAAADQINFQQAFEVLLFLAEETEYSVWVPAISGFNTIRDKLLSISGGSEHVEKFFLRLLEKVIQELGFDERKSDNFITLRNRMQISEFACKIGHQACIDHAVATFRAFIDNATLVPTSLRPVVYCYGLMRGTAEDYNSMYQRKIVTKLAGEALVIETALGCTTHHGKLENYLEQMVSEDSSLPVQDVTLPLTRVLSNPDNFKLAFGFLKKHYGALRNASSTTPSVLSYFPDSAIRITDLAEFEEWLEACSFCQPKEVEATKDAIQSAKSLRAWTQERLSVIVDSAKSKNRLTVGAPRVRPIAIVFELQIE